MSKISIKETGIESPNSEFKYDDSENQLRKKIKLENQKMVERIKKIDENIDINEHEVHKFLLIFHILAETINSQESHQETDGLVTDTIAQIVNIIAGLLKNNIDNLNLPAVLKSALKKLKGLFIQTKDKEEGKSGESEPENAAISVQTEEASDTSGMGQRNNNRRRVRNRRFKIKRFMLQPKNIDVKHNGRVVRRMVVRRQTIYPTIPRTREY